MSHPCQALATAGLILLVACAQENHELDDVAGRGDGYDIVSGALSMDSLHIPAGQTISFDPQRTTTLTITGGSILVYGVLQMRPAGPGVVHEIIFTEVDESRYVGQGMGPTGPGDPLLRTDRGLWVMGSGVLDLVGTERTGWTREPAIAVGWRSTDEVYIAPTAEEDYKARRWRAGDPVPRAFPEVPPAEVFNLTRNVIVRGTTGGMAHVFIRSSKPQRLEYVDFRYLGPAEDDLKRWAVHFHHSMDGSRGSIVRGCVARDGRARAFVAHMSHGVTFEDCISFRVEKAAFWWDPHDGDEKNFTHDNVWRHCLAGETKGTGFFMAAGDRNLLEDSAAFGTFDTGTTGAGLEWGSRANTSWEISDFVSHNNAEKGLYWWENSILPSVMSDVAFYNNGSQRLMYGAYGANVGNVRLVSRGDMPSLHAAAKSLKDGTTVAGIFDGDIDVLGRRPHAIEIDGSNAPGGTWYTVLNTRLAGWQASPVGGGVAAKTRRFQFVDTVVRDGSVWRDLQPADFTIAVKQPTKDYDLVIRVQRRDRSAFQMTWTGENPARKVTNISAFYP